jgi:hypothetical protein
MMASRFIWFVPELAVRTLDPNSPPLSDSTLYLQTVWDAPTTFTSTNRKEMTQKEFEFRLRNGCALITELYRDGYFARYITKLMIPIV